MGRAAVVALSAPAKDAKSVGRHLQVQGQQQPQPQKEPQREQQEDCDEYHNFWRQPIPAPPPPRENNPKSICIA